MFDENAPIEVGFIGCGNMGGALARAVAKTSGARLRLSSVPDDQARQLAAELGGQAADNQTIARECRWIFFAVKPQVMPSVLAEIAPVLAARAGDFTLVTIAAGLSIAQIREMAGGDYPMIRLMPNTPASIGAGMTLYCTSGISAEEEAAFLRQMAAAGRFDPLAEHLIDAGSAVSGCGPAYVYQFIEALADGGVACGLPRDKAQLYAAQTLLGAARLVLESGKHPGALKDAVCSPGGSTIQGVRTLEQRGVRGAVIDAVVAAYDKTCALGGK